jgi:hypothetical protein
LIPDRSFLEGDKRAVVMIVVFVTIAADRENGNLNKVRRV